MFCGGLCGWSENSFKLDNYIFFYSSININKFLNPTPTGYLSWRSVYMKLVLAFRNRMQS